MPAHVIARTYNPDQYPVVQVVASEKYQTASLILQFNIDHPPIAGTVYVSEGNNGEVELTLPTGTKLASEPQWRPYGEDPPQAYSKLMVDKSSSVDSHGDQVVKFEVKRGHTTTASTVQIAFTVDYQ